MLDILRRGANSWLSKVLLSLIILSFVAFGVTTRLTDFGGPASAFEIGGTKMSGADFQAQYTRVLDNYMRRIGQQLSRQDILGSGLSQQVVNSIVRRAVLTEEARQLGLGVSDDAVRQSVVEDPAFKGANGQYDPAMLDRQLYNDGYRSRDAYVADRRDDMMRRQISEALSGGLKPPKAMLEILNRYANEERSIRYVVLDAGAVGEVADPAPDVLAKYFDERKAAFRTPELRKLQILTLDPAKISKADDISDDEARAVYTREIDRYTTPEKRRVQQLPFNTKDDAEAAAKRIAEGTSFDSLITELKLKPEDVDQGLLERKAFIDPAVADAAFKLTKAGDVSGVIPGRFRTVIIRVTEIQPEDKAPFDVVKPAIKTSLAAQKADVLVKATMKQIESARDERMSFADIAKKFNLELQVIDAIDKDGKDASGKVIDTIPEAAKIAKASFETDVGNQNDAMTLGNGGYLFYDVLQIMPPRDRTLDEVKADITARWKAEQVRTRLNTRSAELVARLEKGESFDDLAKAEKLDLKTTEHFKRTDRPEGVPSDAIMAAFNGGEGAVGTGRTETDGRIVLQVKDIVDPIFFADADTLKQPTSQLQSEMRISLEAEYLRRVQTMIGVQVNQSVVSQITGESRPN